MASTYTQNNKFEKPGVGEQAGGTWGSTSNTNFDLIDSSVDGFVAVALTGTTHTLNIPDAAAADGRNKVISFTGTLAAANTVTVTPNTVEKLYFLQNNTTGGQNVIIAQGSGSTVTIKPGYSSIVYLDGAGAGAGAKEVLTSLKLTNLLEAAGVVFVGSGSGNTTLQAAASASGTLTLPAATDTLVGRSTTDTLSNKTLATPIITTNATVPLVIGGTGTTSTLALRSTSGAGTTGADIIFQTGNNGATEVMRLQNNGNVGIGTSSPGVALDIVRTASDSQIRALANTVDLRVWAYTAGAGIIGTNSVDPLIFATNGLVERVRISTTGNVGIGTQSPVYLLQLSADSAAKPSTNTWTIASDARLKTVIGNYEKGLDAICALRPVRYEYNGLGGMPANGKENISIVAQEAQEVFPECIGTFQGKLHEDDEEETELLNYNGHAVTFALINAIKELKARIETLEAAQR